MDTLHKPSETLTPEAFSISGVASKSKPYALVALAVWLVLVSAGLFVSFYLIEQKQASEELLRRQQIEQIAQGKKLAAEEWVKAQQLVLDNLVMNTSLQLYLTEISNTKPSDDVGEIESLREYLRNMLVAEAEKNGFMPAVSLAFNAGAAGVPASPISPFVTAPMEADAAGIAVMGASGSIVSSTAGFPAIKSLPTDIQSAVYERRGGKPIGPFSFRGATYILFSAPARAVQAEDTDAPLGYVVGLRKMDASLMSLLINSVEAIPGSETLIVKKAANGLEALTASGAGELMSVVSADGASLAENIALSQPNVPVFGKDMRGAEVLAVGMAVGNTDLYIVHKFSKAFAMKDSSAFQLWLLSVYMLSVSCLTAIAFAVWRQVEALKLKEVVSRYQRIISVVGQPVIVEKIVPSDAVESKTDNKLSDSEANTAPAEVSVNEKLYEQKQQQYERLFSSLIQSLVAAVDSRDPNAQNHSEYVSYIAHDVAMEMGLSPDEVKATTLAARLMNVGKIKAPDKALTQANITAADKKKVRLALSASADMLKDVPFDVPVVETLRQAREHVDGSGPLKMSGDQLLPSAKIIALVNAFVAMISPRSYRDPLAASEALDELRDSLDTIYSRDVFLALENYLNNDSGSKLLDKMRKQFAD